MDGAAHTVVELGVEFRKSIHFVDAGILDVTDGCSLNNVPDNKLLDSLVLRHAAGAVGAADGPHMASPLLAAPVITALLSHNPRPRHRSFQAYTPYPDPDPANKSDKEQIVSAQQI